MTLEIHSYIEKEVQNEGNVFNQKKHMSIIARQHHKDVTSLHCRHS